MRSPFRMRFGLALLLVSCARAAGPPAIAIGTPCAGCGMEVSDLRFACERAVRGRWRVYDSIECLIHDRVGVAPTSAVALTDYDHRTLHSADSLWVVRGRFPTPMGGGFAAFLDRGAAESVASSSAGTVGRLADFVASGEVEK